MEYSAGDKVRLPSGETATFTGYGPSGMATEQGRVELDGDGSKRLVPLSELMPLDPTHPAYESARRGLPLEERSARLEAVIRKYAARGYVVRYKDATSAQMVRPKKFSFLWALVWFLALGIGLVVYLLYYASKRDDLLNLWVDEKGMVHGGY